MRKLGLEGLIIINSWIIMSSIIFLANIILFISFFFSSNIQWKKDNEIDDSINLDIFLSNLNTRTSKEILRQCLEGEERERENNANLIKRKFFFWYFFCLSVSDDIASDVDYQVASIIVLRSLFVIFFCIVLCHEKREDIRWSTHQEKHQFFSMEIIKCILLIYFIESNQDLFLVLFSSDHVIEICFDRFCSFLLHILGWYENESSTSIEYYLCDNPTVDFIITKRW